jgi:hypothetical protein
MGEWVDEQRRREREERKRRRLAEIRAALSNKALTALKGRAEEALATDGVNRTRLGDEVLVRLKMDDLLEWDYLLVAGQRAKGPGGDVSAVTAGDRG